MKSQPLQEKLGVLLTIVNNTLGTEFNLAEDEAEELRQILGELRSRYVQIAKLVAAQMASGTATAAPSEPASGTTTPGGLHIP